MFTDYSRLFEEDEQKFCSQHLKKDGFGGLAFPKISKEFRAQLELVLGKDALYEHYVCSICGFPTEFYVRFCWWCEKEFYGPPKHDQCHVCKTKDWSI